MVAGFFFGVENDSFYGLVASSQWATRDLVLLKEAIDEVESHRSRVRRFRTTPKAPAPSSKKTQHLFFPPLGEKTDARHPVRKSFDSS